MLFNKTRLAIKHIHFAVGHLSVNQQGHTLLRHRFQRRVDVLDGGDPGIRIGGGTRWIQLGRGDSLINGFFDDFRAGVVSKVQNHERLPEAISRPLINNTLPVGQRLCRIPNRRGQVGHDDGATKVARGGRDSSRQHFVITKVQVPIVRAGDGEFCSHGNFRVRGPALASAAL